MKTPPAVLCRDAVWSAGINFTLVDLSCAGGDYLTVHAGEDAGSPVLWRGCRVTPPFVVWQSFTASVSAASMLVRVTVGTGRSSGVGTGWQVSTDGLPRIALSGVCMPTFASRLDVAHDLFVFPLTCLRLVHLAGHCGVGGCAHRHHPCVVVPRTQHRHRAGNNHVRMTPTSMIDGHNHHVQCRHITPSCGIFACVRLRVCSVGGAFPYGNNMDCAWEVASPDLSQRLVIDLAQSVIQSQLANQCEYSLSLPRRRPRTVCTKSSRYCEVGTISPTSCPLGCFCDCMLPLTPLRRVRRVDTE